ncbi:immunoglobulin lambda-like polypeptide 5 [Pseudorasbora parva]|uniref:immunoglobulin lambda-like polypeptide 5 n=1 Tax=Pseudorasbora parva TaxID=51549 RepID=UPI00351E73D5
MKNGPQVVSGSGLPYVWNKLYRPQEDSSLSVPQAEPGQPLYLVKKSNQLLDSSGWIWILYSAVKTFSLVWTPLMVRVKSLPDPLPLNLDGVPIVSLWWTFGGGTKLVIAGPTVKPSVSLLPPSSLQISGDSAALLCLLSSYSPQGALVSWTLDGSEVTEGVLTSAESQQDDGRYSRSSVLTLSKARWEEGEVYVCRVTHDGAPPHEVSFHKSSEC